MIQKQYFGTLNGYGEVFSYLLRNQSGMSVRILELGGAIMNRLLKAAGQRVITV